MAWSKRGTGHQILHLLQGCGIEVDEREANQLKKDGYTYVSGFLCKAANKLGEQSFRGLVCPDWFRGVSDAKPNIRACRTGFDYQLIPTRRYLFAVYYLALRDYALQLESDREQWFNKPYWGMVVDEESGVFVWKGGNVIQFPLLVVSSPLDLVLRAKQYHALRNSLISCTA